MGTINTTDEYKFTINLVQNGKILGDANKSFEPGVTYYIEYSLDYTGTADSIGDYSTTISNHGHWHTDGDLPNHDDDHTTDETPKSPEWKEPTKINPDVTYGNTTAGIPETSLEHNGTTWYADNYQVSGDDNGDFVITYQTQFSQPRDLTSVVLTDTTDIPSESGNYSEFVFPMTLTVTTDAGVATTYSLTDFDGFLTNYTSNNEGKLAFQFDLNNYLKNQTGSEEEYVLPKNYTVTIDYSVKLKSAMEDAVTRFDIWTNKAHYLFNGLKEAEATVETTIKKRLDIQKDVLDSENISADGGTADPGETMTYVIQLGEVGDTQLLENYTLTDTMTNYFVQKYDTDSFKVYSDAARTTQILQENTPTFTTSGSYTTGFSFTVPAGTDLPVYLVYTVTNITQTDADHNNEDNDPSNNVYGTMTEKNTVTTPDGKTDTTIYTVTYDSGYSIEKDFKRWDADKNIITWSAKVKAVSGIFPAGYKVTETAFKYSNTAPTGDNNTWSETDVANATGDLTLDMSKVTVRNGNNNLVKGTDYRVDGGTIVLLKDITASELTINGIRTSIPGYDPDTVTDTLYFYNDVTFLTDTDSVLGEDEICRLYIRPSK